MLKAGDRIVHNSYGPAVVSRRAHQERSTMPDEYLYIVPDNYPAVEKGHPGFSQQLLVDESACVLEETHV